MTALAYAFPTITAHQGDAFELRARRIAWTPALRAALAAAAPRPALLHTLTERGKLREATLTVRVLREEPSADGCVLVCVEGEDEVRRVARGRLG